MDSLLIYLFVLHLPAAFPLVLFVIISNKLWLYEICSTSAIGLGPDLRKPRKQLAPADAKARAASLCNSPLLPSNHPLPVRGHSLGQALLLRQFRSGPGFAGADLALPGPASSWPRPEMALQRQRCPPRRRNAFGPLEEEEGWGKRAFCLDDVNEFAHWPETDRLERRWISTALTGPLFWPPPPPPPRWTHSAPGPLETAGTSTQMEITTA